MHWTALFGGLGDRREPRDCGSIGDLSKYIGVNYSSLAESAYRLLINKKVISKCCAEAFIRKADALLNTVWLI